MSSSEQNLTTIFSAENVSVFMGKVQIIKQISLNIYANQVTALIGASGSGKTTFLRCLNRLNDETKGFKLEGKIVFQDKNIYDQDVDVVALRTQIGMVFQKPIPFAKSIYENVAYGPKLHKFTSKKPELDSLVEDSLRKASLWEEVKDRLNKPAYELSGGQIQRLAIARTIAIKPQVILMDEPCSALDPIATARIEELMDELRESYTIILVTHSMQQAARVSQRTAFFDKGELIEEGLSSLIFTNPRNELTERYITGRG